MAGREKNCEWYFSRQEPPEVGPNNAQELQFTDKPYWVLIREALQNSLDAVADPSSPVVVRIKFGEILWKQFPNLFSIKKHIQGCVDKYGEERAERFVNMADIVPDYGAMGFICVSDSNTTGMSYSDDVNSPFYAFALSTGVSNKQNRNAGGSFGFGKVAYFKVSPIRTILLSSRDSTTLQPVFVGLSSLCTHFYDGEDKSAVGYYGEYDEMSGRCLPVTNDEGIPKSFRPAENGGTSIFIIGTDKSAEGKSSAKQDMINAVLRNYWMAILHNKLEVIIDDFEINADTLDSIMRSNYKDSVDYITTKRRLKPLAYYDAVVNCNKEGYVHITDHKICTGDLHLFVKKHHDACDKILCMRRNRMLIEVRRPQTNYGYNAVLLCDGAQGDKMLRLLENASHDKWSVRNLEAKTGRSTEQAQKVLDTIEEFVNKSIEQIFHTDNVSTSNITGLEDYLFVPEDLIANPNSVPSTVENANPHIGNPTGEMQDEGASITNIIDEPVQMPERKAEQTGHVIVTQRGGTTPSSTGTRLTGQGVKHEAEVGPKPETPQASGNFQLSEVDEELPGNFMEYIPVKFRVLAKKIGGQMYHDIIFHSPCAATSGRIDIVVGGEQKNVTLDIAEAMPGIIEGNSVGNLSISQGRNKVRVRFNDNLKHAVILQTYGYK